MMSSLKNIIFMIVALTSLASCQESSKVGLLAALSPFESNLFDTLEVFTKAPGFNANFAAVKEQKISDQLVAMQSSVNDEAFEFNGHQFSGIKSHVTGRISGERFAPLDAKFKNFSNFLASQGVSSRITAEDVQAFVKVATAELEKAAQNVPGTSDFDLRTRVRALHVALAYHALSLSLNGQGALTDSPAEDGAGPSFGLASGSSTSTSTSTSGKQQCSKVFGIAGDKAHFQCYVDNNNNSKPSVGWTAVDKKKCTATQGCWEDAVTGQDIEYCSNKDDYTTADGKILDWGWTGTKSCHKPLDGVASTASSGIPVTASKSSGSNVNTASNSAGTTSSSSSGKRKKAGTTGSIAGREPDKQCQFSPNPGTTGDNKMVKCGEDGPENYQQAGPCNCGSEKGK